MLRSHFLGFGGEKGSYRVSRGVGRGQGGDPADRDAMVGIGRPPGFKIPPGFSLERGIEWRGHPPPSGEVVLLVGHLLVGFREAAPVVSPDALVQSEQVRARQSAGIGTPAPP